MIQYYYSDNRLKDYTEEFCKQLVKKNISAIICDFPDEVLDSNLCDLLSKYDIDCYYTIKLYYETNLEDLEKQFKKAIKFNFSGVALDGEAYSNSDVWYTREKYLYYLQLPALVSKYFKNVVILPENLGGDRYELYQAFLDEMYYQNPSLIVLLERTYETWLPWQLKYYYERAKSFNSKVAIGIWPESLSDFKFMWKFVEKYNLQKIFDKTLWLRKIISYPCVIIQKLYTSKFKFRFLYTETKLIP